MAVSDV